MKLFLLAIVFLAGGAFAAIPSTSLEWYKPDKFSFTGASAKWSEGGKDYGATIDREGDILWYKKPHDKNLQSALEYALTAYANTQWNLDMIKTLGENLHKVFSTDGITITGKTPDGSIGSYTIKFSSGIGNSNTIQAESNRMNWNLADESSLHLKKGNKIEIKGWSSAYNNGSIFDMPGADLVCRTTAGIKYGKFGGIDKSSLNLDSKGKLQISGWEKGPSQDYLSFWEQKSGQIMMRDPTKPSDGPAFVSFYGVDTNIFNVNGDKKLQLKNFGNPSASSPTSSLSDELASDSDKKPMILARAINGNLNYLKLGKLKQLRGDGASIAVISGSGDKAEDSLSLYDFSSASDETFAMKKNNKLSWLTLNDIIDYASLSRAPRADGSMRVEVNGFSSASAGTIPYKSGDSIGWKGIGDMVDNRSIALNPNGKIAIKGWNPNYSGKVPLLLANMGGVPNWIELAAATGGCACTNKWENLLSYMTDGKNNSADLSFTYDSIEKMLKEKYGFVYSTTPADLHFSKEGDTMTASFNAPGNWADDTTIEVKDGKYQIKNFANATACSAELSTMLKNPTSSDAVKHYFLAKEISSGNLHYVSIGKEALGGDMKIDGASIETNSASRISIAGFEGAADGKVLSKSGGSIAWIDVAGGAPVDDASITTNTTHGAMASGNASIYGFADAPSGTVPIVYNKKLVWGCPGNFALYVIKNDSGIRYKIDSGNYIKARASYNISGIEIGNSNCYVYLEMSFASNSASLKTGSSVPANDYQTTYIPLYQITSGSIKDYRNAPHIQVWE